MFTPLVGAFTKVLAHSTVFGSTIYAAEDVWFCALRVHLFVRHTDVGQRYMDILIEARKCVLMTDCVQRW